MSVSQSVQRISVQRDLFEIPEDVTYLNCATLSPQLRSVTAAGLNAVAAKKSPWQISAPDWFTDGETLRALAGKIIGADADAMALVPSVSYGVAIAASNVRVERGESILVLHEDFPSNFYAWNELARRRDATLRTVKREIGESWTQAILKSIDNDTAVVAVPNCHWTDGSLIDLVKVGEKARSVGAAFVVDASQSMGAYLLDVRKVQPDFLVAVGYKWLLGPYSLGYLYASPKWRMNGTPLEYTWLARKGSENFASLVDYQDEYRPGARRFDVGEYSNFVLLPMAIAALRQILAWGVENIQASISVLTTLIARNAADAGYVCSPEEQRVGHLIGIRLPRGIPENLTKKLSEARTYVSVRGNAIRVAPYLYNTEADIEKLFQVLGDLK